MLPIPASTGPERRPARGAVEPAVLRRPLPVVATTLFADLRRFTGLSHSLGPIAAFALLDDYCRLVRPCLVAQDCAFARFIGDGVMAVFGLPPAVDDAAERAVRAAVALQRDIAAWNRDRRAADAPAVEIGIGIDTDLVAVGRLTAGVTIPPAGSPPAAAEMEVACVGDGINVAARLEKACKRYASGILITESTRRRLAGVHDIRPVDSLIIDGRTDAIDIFEVLDHRPASGRGERQRQISLSVEALGLYRQRRFGDAAARYERVVDLDPCDDFARRQGKRCRQLQQRPPAADWRPVSRLAAT